MTSDKGTVIQTQRNGALWLTIDRPEVRNALNDDVITGLSAGLSRAEADRDIHAVVITGAGERAFCAGADLRPDSGIFDYDFSDPGTAYARLMRQAINCNLPLVARVNGTCMAGGFGFLSMCDLAVGASHALFGLPEVKIGMFPMQVVAVLQRRLPRALLNELCLTGEPISADEALQSGLLNYVVPKEELDEKTDWLVGRIVDKSPTALRRGKHALRAVADMTFEQSIAYMEAQIGSLRMTKDASEGLSAFVQKRKPVWTGK